MGNEGQPEHRRRPSPWELAPAWIAAIGTLIAAMAAAGFFVGRASSETPSQTPGTAIATTTLGAPSVTVTTPTSAAPGQVTNTASAASSTAPQPAGTVLGSYSFTIVSGYSVPISDKMPTQAQFTAGSGSGDVYFYGSTFFAVGSINKLLGLTNNPVPTYQLCKTTTIFARSVPVSKGTTFCLAEAGQVAGLTVTSYQQTTGQATVSVVVWSDPAS